MQKQPNDIKTIVQKTIKKRKRKRLFMVFIGLIILSIATALVLYAMRDSASFFRTPSEITAEDLISKRAFRLGGFVEKGSVQKQNGLEIIFKITDFTSSKEVHFTGILPDLFREGQGIIAEGVLNGNYFRAQRVLAKHDETYVPKEIVDRLKSEGLWEGYQNNDR